MSSLELCGARVCDTTARPSAARAQVLSGPEEARENGKSRRRELMGERAHGRESSWDFTVESMQHHSTGVEKHERQFAARSVQAAERFTTTT
jgi:hypothetical protein